MKNQEQNHEEKLFLMFFPMLMNDLYKKERQFCSNKKKNLITVRYCQNGCFIFTECLKKKIKKNSH